MGWGWQKKIDIGEQGHSCPCPPPRGQRQIRVTWECGSAGQKELSGKERDRRPKIGHGVGRVENVVFLLLLYCFLGIISGHATYKGWQERERRS